MKVRDIMTTDVATATPDTTLEDVATMMRDEDTGAIPVLDEAELVGIITDRDIVIRCIAEGKDPVETTVEDVLTEGLETIEPDADVSHAHDLMSRRQVRRLPVVEEGEFIGIVSIGDIAVKSDTNVSHTLESVSEGVKASGTKTKSAKRTGNTRDSENEGDVPNIESGRKANARAGREGGSQAGRGNGRNQASGNARKQNQSAGGRSQGISNRGGNGEKRRQNKVIAKGGTRRRAS
jgi:CBS domain-containing protein